MDRIVTLRLVLRPLDRNDAAPMTALLSDWEVVRWLARPPYPYGLADAEAFLATVTEPAMAATPNAAIEVAGRFAGVVAIDRGKQGPEIGYWLGRPFQGQGTMTAAATALTRHFFKHCNATELHSGYFAGNTASANVLSKLGFAPTGSRPVFNRPHNREMPHIDMRLDRARFETLHP